MWQMVGILAELERSLIQERTQAGRAVALARGVKMGRKPLLSAQQVAHARKLIEQGSAPTQWRNRSRCRGAYFTGRCRDSLN
jgi:DNA invertase Pin-like site-specific DNA recombinase